MVPRPKSKWGLDDGGDKQAHIFEPLVALASFRPNHDVRYYPRPDAENLLHRVDFGPVRSYEHELFVCSNDSGMSWLSARVMAILTIETTWSLSEKPSNFVRASTLVKRPLQIQITFVAVLGLVQILQGKHRRWSIRVHGTVHGEG